MEKTHVYIYERVTYIGLHIKQSIIHETSNQQSWAQTLEKVGNSFYKICKSIMCTHWFKMVQLNYISATAFDSAITLILKPKVMQDNS